MSTTWVPGARRVNSPWERAEPWLVMEPSACESQYPMPSGCAAAATNWPPVPSPRCGVDPRGCTEPLRVTNHRCWPAAMTSTTSLSSDAVEPEAGRDPMSTSAAATVSASKTRTTCPTARRASVSSGRSTSADARPSMTWSVDRTRYRLRTRPMRLYLSLGSYDAPRGGPR